MRALTDFLYFHHMVRQENLGNVELEPHSNNDSLYSLIKPAPPLG
jgi:hypothetical protein